MVSIEVVTEPLGAEVTWDGEIKGISPITIEVELPKTIDDFRSECIGKCGKVDGYMYLPVCEWDVLRGWLESGFVGEHWWELTDDERWCIAYKTTSLGSIDEISKYNLPLYDVTIEPSATSINAIQIKESIASIDGWLFFSIGEPDITPWESDIIPIRSTISIFDGVGDLIVEIDMPYLLLPTFRDGCLSGGSVVCDWTTLEEWLVSGDVGVVWWGLTDDERYSIADTAVRSWAKTVGAISEIRDGEENCEGGTGEWRVAECIPNAIIRYVKFGECPKSMTSCYYNDSGEHCYCQEMTYHLPVYIVSCSTPVNTPPGDTFGHAMVAIQIKENTNDLTSWYIFQYRDPRVDEEDCDIQLGEYHLPINTYLELLIKINDPIEIAVCSGYTSTTVAEWHFIDGAMA